MHKHIKMIKIHGVWYASRPGCQGGFRPGRTRREAAESARRAAARADRDHRTLWPIWDRLTRLRKDKDRKHIIFN